MATKAIKQETFVWEGANRSGSKVKGETTGNNIALIKAELRRQGIVPTKVKKKPKPLFSSKKPIKPSDIAVFSRQLATMMSAGVPLVQSFEIIGRGHDNPSMSELLMNVKSDIESGSTLAESLAKHPIYFDELFCNLVHAGEQAGILESILDKVATYKERVEAVKSKIKKALFYPGAVMTVAFIITAILMIFVIPQFQDLFSGFGADLPAPTLVVISISEYFQEYWWAIFGGIILAIMAFINAKKRSKKFNRMLDRILLRVPIFGSIFHKAAIARYARTLATMFAAGVPLVEAMDSVAGATGNVVYGDAVIRMRDEIATGQQLNVAMKQQNIFPNMVIQMTAIGEESGAIDTMLSKVADFYEEEVNDSVDALSSLMEPIIMVVLGVLIGGMVIAMYLPIFKLGEVV